MSKYNKTILTDAGLDLAKRANAGKAKFKITRAVTSSEDLSRKTITELQALTDLPSPMQTGTILDAEPTETDNAIIGVSLRFTNKDLTNSYPIRAVGLYVKEEGKDSDFLYALSTAQEPEFMPDYSDQVLYRFNINMYVVVGRVQNVTVEILDGTSVPYEAFNRHIKETTTRFEDLERTRAKSATVNGGEKVLPDNDGNLALTVPDPDLSKYYQSWGYSQLKNDTLPAGLKRGCHIVVGNSAPAWITNYFSVLSVCYLFVYNNGTNYLFELFNSNGYSAPDVYIGTPGSRYNDVSWYKYAESTKVNKKES